MHSSRNCIGKMFSMQEMRLCITSLVKQFTIKPIAESMEDAKDRRQFITLNLAKNSFKVQMALRK
jgi:cytochrome P450